MKRLPVLLVTALTAASLAHASSLNGLGSAMSGEAIPEPATLAAVGGAFIALATLILKRTRSRELSRRSGRS